MRKQAIVLILALCLGGCAGTPIRDVFDIATTPITVTPAMSQDIQEGFKVASAGLVAYRRLCVKKVIDPVTRNCLQVITTIQPYTKAAKAAIVDLRIAISQNNQASAVTAYTTLQKLIVNIQTERQIAGVK